MKGFALRFFVIASVFTLLQACGEGSSNDAASSGGAETGQISDQGNSTATSMSEQSGIDQVQQTTSDATDVGESAPQALPQDSGSSQNQ